MVMPIAQQLGTATLADLLRMPEEDRYELVDGVLVPKEAASSKHGEAQGRAFRSLSLFDRRPGPPERPGGWRFSIDALIDFGPRQVRMPDVAGWRRERLAEFPLDAYVRVLPDWVAEVISPGNSRSDTVKKMRLYHATRIPHYWLLDPRDSTLAVYRWSAEGYVHVLGATGGERVRAEPFDAIEISVGVLFGDDEDEPATP